MIFLYGRKIWTHRSFVLSQITRLTDKRTDSQMERQTEFSLLERMQRQWTKNH